jgi:hypothetical protein
MSHEADRDGCVGVAQTEPTYPTSRLLQVQLCVPEPSAISTGMPPSPINSGGGVLMLVTLIASAMELQFSSGRYWLIGSASQHASCYIPCTQVIGIGDSRLGWGQIEEMQVASQGRATMKHTQLWER